MAMSFCSMPGEYNIVFLYLQIIFSNLHSAVFCYIISPVPRDWCWGVTASSESAGPGVIGLLLWQEGAEYIE